MSKKKTSNYKDNLVARSEEAKMVRKIVSIIVISLVLIIAIGGISGYIYVKGALEPVSPDSDKKLSVNIPLGSSTSEIAEILEKNGIIKDALIFRFYIKLKNESDFQAGNYTFTPSLALDEIIEALKNGKVLAEPIYKVTIPEGQTIDQMAEIFAKKLPIEKEDFLKKINDPVYIEKLIDVYPGILTEEIMDPNIRSPLEGYLFAATYNFYEEEPAIDLIVEKMLDKTKEIATPFLDDISAKGFTVHEALTMASLVEKEAKTEEQRKKIAGVFYNRLDDGMKLQTDPTVLYALGENKDKVLLKDLEIDSPYNTYQIDSLPIGPISNFGESSLQAALNPEKSDYKYFLHDAKGNIYFAETYQEHLKLKDKYIK